MAMSWPCRRVRPRTLPAKTWTATRSARRCLPSGASLKNSAVPRAELQLPPSRSLLLQRLQIFHQRGDLLLSQLGAVCGVVERFAPDRHVASTMACQLLASVDNPRDHLGRIGAPVSAGQQSEIRRLPAQQFRERTIALCRRAVAGLAVLVKQRGSTEDGVG